MRGEDNGSGNNLLSTNGGGVGCSVLSIQFGMLFCEKYKIVEKVD